MKMMMMTIHARKKEREKTNHGVELKTCQRQKQMETSRVNEGKEYHIKKEPTKKNRKKYICLSCFLFYININKKNEDRLERAQDCSHECGEAECFG